MSNKILFLVKTTSILGFMPFLNPYITPYVYIYSKKAIYLNMNTKSFVFSTKCIYKPSNNDICAYKSVYTITNDNKIKSNGGKR